MSVTTIDEDCVPYFEIGKAYRHSGGGVMKIVGSACTTTYGYCLVAEEWGGGNLLPVGQGGGHTTGWRQITEQEWLEGFELSNGKALAAVKARQRQYGMVNDPTDPVDPDAEH